MCLPNNRNLWKIQCPELWLHTNFRQIKVSCNGERRRLLVTEVKWWHENELTGRMQLILFLSKRCCSRAYGKSNVTFRSCWEELNTEHEQISQDLKGLVLWSIHTFHVFITILFTCSWSHPPSWPSSCFRVSAVRRTCLCPWCRKSHCRRIRNISDTSVKL